MNDQEYFNKFMVWYKENYEEFDLVMKKLTDAAFPSAEEELTIKDMRIIAMMVRALQPPPAYSSSSQFANYLRLGEYRSNPVFLFMNPWFCDRNEAPIIMMKTTDYCGAFLNMCRGYEIQYDDTTWYSSEHLYQAHRFEEPLHRRLINKAPNAYEAKQRMKRIRDDGYSVSEDLWNLVKVPIMEMCLNLKFDQHEGLKKLLISTYPKPLVEYSTKGDKFWGCEYDSNKKLAGKNTLGKLLMKIRFENLDNQTKLNV